MTKYESFIKRYEEINLIKDEDEQNNELSKLDEDIKDWIREKYPELDYLYLEEISDDLKDTERHFMEFIVDWNYSLYDIVDLIGFTKTELIKTYLDSKDNSSNE